MRNDPRDGQCAALVHLLAERFKFTQHVGRLKATTGMPASDPERERVQIARLRALAEESHLDPAFAEKFLKFIVAEVIYHHEKLANTGSIETESRTPGTRLDSRRRQARRLVVTGAGRGVGYFAAKQLAAAGARVITTTRGEPGVALESLRRAAPDADVSAVQLDVASFGSIRTAATELGSLGPIDILVNNAGKTSGSRARETTVDGLEIMVGMNALGPFALTARLWPALAPDARVIGLSSLSTRLAKADLSERMSLLAHPGFALDGNAAPRPGITDLISPARLCS